MKTVVMLLVTCVLSSILLQENPAINAAYENEKWLKRIESDRKLDEGQIDDRKTSKRLYGRKGIIDEFNLFLEKRLRHTDGDIELDKGQVDGNRSSLRLGECIINKRSCYRQNLHKRKIKQFVHGNDLFLLAVEGR